jgi:hypothetical protein
MLTDPNHPGVRPFQQQIARVVHQDMVTLDTLPITSRIVTVETQNNR